MSTEAVLFDVDFTICRPGPELSPRAYAERGRALGLDLDPSLFELTRRAALAELKLRSDLTHDEELWIDFSEKIIRGMGGKGEGVRVLAQAMVLAWERAEHFELYGDVLPALTALRERGVKIGLVSNTARDLPAFVIHHGLPVDALIGAREHGRSKPDPSIFATILDSLGVRPQRAVMVGDSPEDDIEGARALGMRAILIDRSGQYPSYPDRLTSLVDLGARLTPASRETQAPAVGKHGKSGES